MSTRLSASELQDLLSDLKEMAQSGASIVKDDAVSGYVSVYACVNDPDDTDIEGEYVLSAGEYTEENVLDRTVFVTPPQLAKRYGEEGWIRLD